MFYFSVYQILIDMVKGKIIDFNVFTSLLRLYTQSYLMLSCLHVYLTTQHIENRNIVNVVGNEHIITVIDAITYIKR